MISVPGPAAVLIAAVVTVVAAAAVVAWETDESVAVSERTSHTLSSGVLSSSNRPLRKSWRQDRIQPGGSGTSVARKPQVFGPQRLSAMVFVFVCACVRVKKKG